MTSKSFWSELRGWRAPVSGHKTNYILWLNIFESGLKLVMGHLEVFVNDYKICKLYGFDFVIDFKLNLMIPS